MKRGITLALVGALALGIAVPLTALAITRTGSQETIPLKEAKLIIEHNATDEDTGFQGFIDSEGWQSLVVTGPDGDVLSLKALQELGQLGLTELFFETVEPANADVSIEDVLATLPEGDYQVEGVTMEAGESSGGTSAVATLTHAIPAGPELLSPSEGEVTSTTGVVMSWAPVTETITGEDVTIVAYQLIVEMDTDPAPNMIGKLGLSMYVSPEVTSISLPDNFLVAGATYSWEVLAIEESGNQTLSSGEFETE